MTCPALPFDGDATITATLSALDCQVNGAVASGYDGLFGASGAFGVALGVILTIYLTIMAIGLLTGRTRLTLPALGPKVLALGFVLTFATAWPAYQTVIYGLFTGGPDQVASAFMGARSGATQAFAARLDTLFEAVLDVGQTLTTLPKSPNLGVATNLVWTSAVTLLLFTLGLLVIARLVLAVLLALGPIFIVFGLFEGTRGLFEGWLRSSVAFALAPLLIVLGGSGAMVVLGPLITAIGDDPVRAVTELRPVVSLFLASVIYAGLLVALMATAISLTRGWRLRSGADAPADRAPPPASAGGVTGATVLHAGGATPPLAANDDRVSGLAAAVLRDGVRATDTRVHTLIEAASAAAPSPPIPEPRRRLEGLGQTFRATPPHRALTGQIGS